MLDKNTETRMRLCLEVAKSLEEWLWIVRRGNACIAYHMISCVLSCPVMSYSKPRHCLPQFEHLFGATAPFILASILHNTLVFAVQNPRYVVVGDSFIVSL